MGGFIEVELADGGSNRGYLAETAERGAPSVVVIQEWWGLQDQITGICDRLAAAGYHALAPDLYGGEVAPYHDSAAAEAAMNALDVMAATEGAVAGAARRLAANGAKVGPKRAARLHQAIQEVLTDAIAQGGSTISNYVNSEGSQGYFQLSTYVYGKTGEPCKVCETPIRRTIVASRSTHFCPRCQRR